MKNLKTSSDLKNKKSAQCQGPSTRAGIERIFKITAYLQNGEVDGKPVTCTTLGQALEVNRSTVMRDLVFLKDRLEVDFEWDAEDQCYILKGDCKHIPCMGLSDVDKLLLNYIGQILAELGPTELGCAMQESYKKLSSLFTGKNPKVGWGIQADFSKVATHSVSEVKVYHLFKRAMDSARCLKIICKNPTHGADERELTIKPERIAFADGKWTLVGMESLGFGKVSVSFNDINQVDLLKNEPAEVASKIIDPSSKMDSLTCVVQQNDSTPRQAA